MPLASLLRRFKGTPKAFSRVLLWDLLILRKVLLKSSSMCMFDPVRDTDSHKTWGTYFLESRTTVKDGWQLQGVGDMSFTEAPGYQRGPSKISMRKSSYAASLLSCSIDGTTERTNDRAVMCSKLLN